MPKFSNEQIHTVESDSILAGEYRNNVLPYFAFIFGRIALIFPNPLFFTFS